MKKSLKESLKLKSFLLLLISGTVNAFGITMFLVPVGLYDSGISGTSMLLGQVTPEWMTLSVFLVVLNVPLFLYGLKKQGAAFTIYSIFAVCVYSVAAWLISDVLPVDVRAASPFAGTDLLLCAVFGGLISGIGSGLTLRAGGAIDGMEVMAVIFAKGLGITVGNFVMAYNVVLYVAAGLICHSWILPLGRLYQCGQDRHLLRGQPLPDRPDAHHRPRHRPRRIPDHLRCGRCLPQCSRPPKTRGACGRTHRRGDHRIKTTRIRIAYLMITT